MSPSLSLIEISLCYLIDGTLGVLYSVVTAGVINLERRGESRIRSKGSEDTQEPTLLYQMTMKREYYDGTDDEQLNKVAPALDRKIGVDRIELQGTTCVKRRVGGVKKLKKGATSVEKIPRKALRVVL